MPAHVFNVPKPYRAQAQEPQQQPEERPRTKFRWFGHSLRLGGSSSKSASPTSPTSPTKESAATHRRTKSAYIATEVPASPTSSSRSASFSSTNSAPFASKSPNDSFSMHKLHFSLLRGGTNHSSSPTSSVRTSIASTASSSEDAPFSLTASNEGSSSSSSHTRHTDDHQIHSPRIEYETRKLLRQVMGMDAVWSDDAHVERHFARLHWRVVRIEADGNCLFRAISDQIYRNEAFYGDIRRRIVEFIDREKELFRPFVENEQTDKHEPIGAYCTRMKKDAQWGGNPELYAAARLFNVHIVVHQGPLRRLRIENGSETPHMELHLLYRNDHYDSLHDESQLDEKPRLSISAALELEDQAEKEAKRVEEELQVQEPIVEQTEKKKKRKKGVVFLGEETRVERVDVDSVDFVPPPVVMRKPVRAVVRWGKVCERVAVDPVSNQEEVEEEPQQEQEDNQELDVSEQTLSIPEEEESSVASAATEVKQDNQTDAHDKELPVVSIKRVSFRKGRRVEA